MTSALPKAVQKQISRANDILESMKNPPPDSQATPPATPPKTDDQSAAPPASPPAEPPKATDTPPVAPAASPSEPPKAGTPPADEGWQHKYNVLQGKYNAEVPRLQKQLSEEVNSNKELRQRLTNMETTVAAMRTVREPPQTPAAPATPPPDETITAQEIETYGADLVDLTRRIARSEARRVVPDIVKPVADKVQKVEQSTSQVSRTVAQSNQQETLRLLAGAVPNWKELDSDAGFLAWLDQSDPYSGMKRGVLLRQAFVANDATRVIAVFKGYLNENAAVQPEPSTPTPPATPAEPQTKMEQLVAPGAPKAPTASAPNEAGKRVWTRKDVSQLYARKNEFIRKHPGKPLPDDLQKLERDLFKAQHEGRVRPA